MSGFLRCGNCPALGPCIVERTGHRRYCEWAESGNAVKIARIRELSDAEPEAPGAYVPVVTSDLARLERAIAEHGTGRQPGGGCGQC